MKKGWEYKKLGEVTTFMSGYTPKKEEIKSFGTFPYFKVAEMNLIGNEKYMTNTPFFISSPLKIFPKGSIIFPKNGGAVYTEKKRILKVDSVIDLNTEAICSGKELYNYYLYYFLSSIKISSFDKGGGLPSLDMKKMAETMIGYPPFEEQRSIVDYLDSAFAKIDAMKANAEKALNEAKALFQASLKEMLEPKEGWEEKKLGDICEIIRGKRFVRADIVEDGVPCIHYGDIYTYYGLSVTKTKGCIKPELAKKMRFAEKNDVVVVQAGENNWDIGVGVAYLGEEPAAVHDACFILKHKQDPMYISYYLRSYNYHWYLLDYVHEGKICSFLKPALENAPIPLPSLSEQHSIAITLDSLKSKVDRLQANYEKISQECDALKQAILRQVFE